jgi:hypothetical protein
MTHRAHDHISQEAFSVAPELLGLPLAGPWRRAAAMALDLALLGVLVNVGGAVLLGIAAVAVFLRLSSRSAPGRMGRGVRLALRGAAALVVFSVSLKLWHRAEQGVENAATAALADMVAPKSAKGGDRSRVLNGLGTGAAFIALQGAGDEGEARRAAHGIVKRMRDTGMKDEDIRGALEEVAEDGSARPWLRAVLVAQADSAGLRKAAPRPAVSVASADSLALAYAAALRARDTAGAHALRPAAGAALAADSLRGLDGRIARLRTENHALQASVNHLKEHGEAVEKRGLLHLIGKVADELGIGFGWSGLYFTAFLALWKGQTPGKRAVGIRVMRLDGGKIGLWGAFERFGGYAASIFTGLLGFVQIFWDRNRQALHDKIVETVVVRVV